MHLSPLLIALFSVSAFASSSIPNPEIYLSLDDKLHLTDEVHRDFCHLISDLNGKSKQAVLDCLGNDDPRLCVGLESTGISHLLPFGSIKEGTMLYKAIKEKISDYEFTFTDGSHISSKLEHELQSIKDIISSNVGNLSEKLKDKASRHVLITSVALGEFLKSKNHR